MNWYHKILLASEYKFSSTQVQVIKSVADKVISFGKKIPDSELAEDGREKDIHITLKYGLHTQNYKDVEEIVKDFGPVKATLGKTSLFETPEFDVLKITVKSPTLRDLNEIICDSLEYTDKHPEYVPHLTIAYLKTGEGKKYANDDFLEGTKLTFNELAFCNKDGEKKFIKL